MRKKTFFTAVFLLILLLMGMTVVVTADNLPPRPIPDGGLPQSNRGATIVLQVTPPQAGWAVVQWQDHLGNWHDVDGWRGAPDANGEVRWWVGGEHFGTGPYRWLVFDAPDGTLLGSSAPFDMPVANRQVVTVPVFLGAPAIIIDGT